MAQLASFSAVEQQIRANDRLRGILEVLSGGSPAGLAEWIGREVRVAAKADFAGEPVEVGRGAGRGRRPGGAGGEERLRQVVARLPVAADADGRDLGRHATRWATRWRTGAMASRWRAMPARPCSAPARARCSRKVQEVRIVDGAPMLVVEGGAQVPLDEVGGLR